MRLALISSIIGLHFASAFSSSPSHSFYSLPISHVAPNQGKAITQFRKVAKPFSGGGLQNAKGSLNGESKCPFTAFSKLASSIYGTTGVLYILGKAIQRVIPVALEPFSKGATPLSQLQLA
jgi:hypothetical protein